MSRNTKQESIEWFSEARFGMFIHWGLYSLLGRGEWARYSEAIPADEYHALAQQFRPRYFDARGWARLAKTAGMKYMVLTAKHHDGFCLFDSQYTDFTSVKTAAKRDFVAEYVEACRAEGLGVGLYFSVKDWDFPAYFDGQLRQAVKTKFPCTAHISFYRTIEHKFFTGDKDRLYRARLKKIPVGDDQIGKFSCIESSECLASTTDLRRDSRQCSECFIGRETVFN